MGPDLNFAGDADAFVAKVSGKPDLTETGEAVVSNPGVVKPGGSITVIDKALDVGLASSKKSVTRYYLSKDAVRSADDILLGGSRTLPALQPSFGHSSSATATVPANTPPGSYRVLACVDDTKTNAENDETQQLLWQRHPARSAPGPRGDRREHDESESIAVDAAGKVYIAGRTFSGAASFPVTVGPDLIHSFGSQDAFVAKISGKAELVETGTFAIPIVVKPGGALTVFDTASNLGLGTAKASTTRYYFSLDTVRSPSDIPLGGSRAVPSLAPGAVHQGSATVTVPTSTALGSYRVLFCADDTKVVAENDETNDCLAGTTVQVTLPYLSVTTVSTAPASVQRGYVFSMTDTVQNLGSVSASTSTTRYYLSTDVLKGVGDILLTGSRPVGVLASSSTSSGAATVAVPAGAAPKTYVLFACADDKNQVKEINETNNCRFAGQITVTP